MKKFYSVWLILVILNFQFFKSSNFLPENLNVANSYNTAFNYKKFAPGDFTFTSTPTNETCTGNGKINVAVSNAIDGATYSLEIFLSSNLTTPISTTSVIASGTSFSYLFNGLGHGTYTVRVTESASSITTPKTQNSIIIYDLRTTLAYNITQKRRCDGNYDIKVNVTSGTAQSYELRNQDGTIVIVAAQSNNIFTNISPGVYRVDVKDICNQNVNQNYTVVAESNYNLNYVVDQFSKKDCDNYYYSFRFSGGSGQISYPINYTLNYTHPVTGNPVTTSGVITGPGIWPPNSTATIYTTVPIPTSANYTISITATDGCNTNYSFSQIVSKLVKKVDYYLTSAGCGQYVQLLTRNMIDPAVFTFTQYPSGFQPNSYNSAFSNTTYSATLSPGFSSVDLGSSTNPLPPGNYTVMVTDACNFSYPVSFTVTAPTFSLINSLQKPGCEINYGNVRFVVSANNSSQDLNLLSATVTASPSGYTGPTSLPIVNGAANLVNAIGGTYTVEGVYVCNGIQYTLSKTLDLIGLSITKNEVIVTPSCGKFDLKIDHTTNRSTSTFYLQLWNPTTGRWTHPDTGYAQGPTDPFEYYNAKEIGSLFNPYTSLTNTLINQMNLTYQGKMRVVLTDNLCSLVLKEFETQPALALNDYYVFNCSPSKVTLAIDATGIQPLAFEIIEKDGVAMSTVNGANPVFTNIDPGTYKVKVTDGCGNSKIFTIFANGLKLPAITANLCDGQNGTLSLPQLNFMNISWNYNGGALPTNVATNSTNSYILNFTPYNKAVHAGTYQAVLNYNFATTCQPVTINYTLTTTNDTAPQAGTGQTVNLNGTSVTAPIDLFTYLTGTYDTNGVWTETTATSSNLLLNNVWYGNIANGGTYTFQYTVKGTCSGTATSSVTIVLDKACYKTPVLDGNVYAGRFGITSLGRAGEDRDNWPMVRQSAHAVLEAKTKGFVLNKMNFDSSNNPIGIPANNFVEGMAVYDTTNNCMKVYFGATIGWKCVKKGGCAPN